MLRSAHTRAAALLSVAVLLVAGVAGLAALQARELVRGADAVARGLRVIASVEALLGAVGDVETSIRSSVLTGRDGSVAVAVQRVDGAMNRVRELLAERPLHARDLATLEQRVRLRIALARNVVDVRRSRGGDEARVLVGHDAGHAASEAIRWSAAALIAREEQLMSERERSLRTAARRTTLVIGIAALVSLVMMGASWLLLHREIAERRRAVASNRRRAQEIESLSRMAHYLQACSTSAEAHAYAARALRDLFPGSSGALCLQGGDTIEVVGRWGAPCIDGPFEPAECWGLRRGTTHVWSITGSDPVCAHVGDIRPATYACLPMLAQGRPLGVLHLASPEPLGLDRERLAVAASAAEQVALALANLQLRDRLRTESLRDPLTGVHNRRFLEEALPRELALASRQRRGLSLLLIDADHFKSYNDRHGHAAGDAVLQAIGELLRERFRGSDIVCRYGGEEFVVVLPEADIENAQERAEELRRAARTLALAHGGSTLPPVTLSIGVAAAPLHGISAARLLRAADAALYAAKGAGRDRVVAAPCRDLTPAH